MDKRINVRMRESYPDDIARLWQPFLNVIVLIRLQVYACCFYTICLAGRFYTDGCVKKMAISLTGSVATKLTVE